MELLLRVVKLLLGVIELLLRVVELFVGASGSVAMRGASVGRTSSWVRSSRRRVWRTRLLLPHFWFLGRRWWTGIVMRVLR